MALDSTEQMERGLVRDTTTGAIKTTSSTSGATWSGGYLRDPDGRLVIKNA